MTKIYLCLLVMVSGGGLFAEAQEAPLPKCLFVGSYHTGYAWQDSVERGLRSVLEGRCEVRQFNMDSKRRPEPEFCRQQALEAKASIERWKPDVLIACDDNASKYLIAPYFKDAELPVVFCGINWTVDEYGYPYSNTTGMIEISPAKALLKYLPQILPEARSAVCLIPDRLTSDKTARQLQPLLASINITLSIEKTATMKDFDRQYRKAQSSDVIIMLNNSAIADWNDAEARQIVRRHSTTLSVTFNEWMLPYSMLGLTLVPEEQGEYAAEAALKILGGTAPSDIPLVANRKWKTFVNKALLEKSGVRLPASILHQAEKVE